VTRAPSAAEVAAARAMASPPAPAGTAVHAGEPTEFDFVLPRGYTDDRGRVHRTGTMRLATARDELVPLMDARVRDNQAYLTVVLLARVITRLGDLTTIDDGVVETMWAADVAFLQDLYRRVNTEGHTRAAVCCPACSEEFAVDLAGGRLGES
jgi:hypothetical protein